MHPVETGSILFNVRLPLFSLECYSQWFWRSDAFGRRMCRSVSDQHVLGVLRAPLDPLAQRVRKVDVVPLDCQGRKESVAQTERRVIQ